MGIILKYKKTSLLLTIIIIVSLFVSYQFIGTLKASHLAPKEKIPYDRDAFIDINEFETLDQERLVAETESLALYFNEETTEFWIEDKISGHTWYSNPQKPDPNAQLGSVVNEQKSTFVVQYTNEIGRLNGSWNNYQQSIEHGNGDKTYAIRYLDNAVQVLYILDHRTIDHTYFPLYLTIERYEEIINDERLDRDAIRRIERYYTLDIDEKDRYVLNGGDPNLSRTVINYLYEYFYEILGYTLEDLERDNAAFDIETKVSKDNPYFEIAIEYRLTEDGFEVSVIRDSIVDTKLYPITGLRLLPYFGAADLDETGYMVVPDGSGAIMNFNNGKHYQSVYMKRFYGHDLALQPEKQPPVTEPLTLPVYGIVNTSGSSGMLAIIEQEPSMMTLNMEVSLQRDSYNKIYPQIHFRELEYVYFYKTGERFPVPNWTEDITDTDYVIKYKFVNGEEANYVGLAHVYRDYLIEEHGLTKKDDTTETILNLSVLGLYDKQEFFLGVPYTAVRSMTSFDETKLIVEAFKAQGVDDLRVTYNGWFNSSIDHRIPTSIDIHRAVGGKRDFNQLIDYLDQEGIDFYPSMNLIKTTEYDKAFDRVRYTAEHINGKSATLYRYNLATRLIDQEGPVNYVINPRYYESLTNKMMKKYNSFDHKYLGINDLGRYVSGSYHERYLTYRYHGEAYQHQVFETLTDELSLSLTAPLGFAIPYATNIIEAPIESTNYPILDGSIPFYQLVLNGYVDYAGVSVNLNSEHGLQFHKLKAIETGSNLHFILSYKDSSDLLNTNYNHYYSTNYRNWIDGAAKLVKELNELKIHEGTIIRHEILQPEIYLVEYSNGNTFIINYSLAPFEYEGQTVNPESYLLVGGDRS